MSCYVSADVSALAAFATEPDVECVQDLLLQPRNLSATKVTSE